MKADSVFVLLFIASAAASPPQRNPDSNAYWLFTRANPQVPQILSFGDEDSVRVSYFNAEKQTVVVAHGWLGNGNAQPNTIIRQAFLDKLDVNIITVDWRRLAMSDYTTAALGVPAAGRALGELINWLVSRYGLRYDNVHFVGFDLGAHLVGVAGRETGGRVARITGLDPAGPLWERSSGRLGPDDGVYVEAIHTNGGANGMGIGVAIAQADFFPNGGVSQPGCFTPLCSHNRAYQLFAATVTFDHLEARLCTSTAQITWNMCLGDALRMGNDDLRKSAGTRGLYRVDTGRSYPY